MLAVFEGAVHKLPIWKRDLVLFNTSPCQSYNFIMVPFILLIGLCSKPCRDCHTYTIVLQTIERSTEFCSTICMKLSDTVLSLLLEILDGLQDFFCSMPLLRSEWADVIIILHHKFKITRWICFHQFNHRHSFLDQQSFSCFLPVIMYLHFTILCSLFKHQWKFSLNINLLNIFLILLWYQSILGSFTFSSVDYVPNRLSFRGV